MFNFKKKNKDEVKIKPERALNRFYTNETRGYKVEFTLKFENFIEGSSVVQSYARTKTINALVGEEDIAQIILREIRRNERFCLNNRQIPDKITLELRYIKYSPIVSTVIATRRVQYQAKTDMKRFKRFYISRNIKD